MTGYYTIHNELFMSITENVCLVWTHKELCKQMCLIFDGIWYTHVCVRIDYICYMLIPFSATGIFAHREEMHTHTHTQHKMEWYRLLKFQEEHKTVKYLEYCTTKAIMTIIMIINNNNNSSVTTIIITTTTTATATPKLTM